MLRGSDTLIPYCGLPPLPSTLWSRWNFDPLLLGVLGALACAYAVGAARRSRAHRGLTRAEQVSFYGGWAVTAMALISPLCALSVSLFSARVSQHMVLALVGAPLVAAGRPWNAFGALCKPGEAAAAAPAATPASSACFAACGLFAALLWCWHAPAPYAATFASNAAYWSMHVSVYGAALWLWHALLDPRPARIVPAIAAGLLTSVQMGLLGALLTLAPRALYTPHALTTESWSLTPLQDQQLGGAIMWVPGCVVFLGVAMLMLRRFVAAAPAAQHGGGAHAAGLTAGTVLS